MAENVIPRYTVSSCEGGAEGRAEGRSVGPALLLAALVLLVIVVACAVWWRRKYRAKPDCGQYSGRAQEACLGLSSVCGSDAGCLNAVAHCVPAFAPPPGSPGTSLKACASAITHVDPAFTAQAAAKYGACAPARLGALLADPQEYAAAMRVLDAAAPLVPYSLSVAQKLPACQ